MNSKIKNRLTPILFAVITAAVITAAVVSVCVGKYTITTADIQAILMARLYSCRTGETVTQVQLLEYAGECLAAEADMAKDSAAASVRRSIPEFVKVLYRYFGEE